MVYYLTSDNHISNDFVINSLRSSWVIAHCGSWWTFLQEMPCCLMAPSIYQNYIYIYIYTMLRYLSIGPSGTNLQNGDHFVHSAFNMLWKAVSWLWLLFHVVRPSYYLGHKWTRWISGPKCRQAAAYKGKLTVKTSNFYENFHFDGKDCRIPFANTLEILQSCIKSSIWFI